MLSHEDKKDMQELLEELTSPLDELMELCQENAYLRAYVPGNVWAERYGFVGKAGLDYLEEWLVNELEGQHECPNCHNRYSEHDAEEFWEELDDPEVIWDKNMDRWCPACIRKALDKEASHD